MVMSINRLSVSAGRPKKTWMVYLQIAVLFITLLSIDGIVGNTVEAGQTSAKSKKERRAPKALSRQAVKYMSAVRTALQSDNYALALLKLDELLAKTKGVERYDKAKAYEMYSHIYSATGEYQKAIKAAEQAMAFDILGHASASQLHYRLIYLYSAMENFVKAIEHIQIWFELEQDPDVQSFFTAAQVYAVSNQWASALQFAERGMQKLKSGTQYKPKQDWYQLAVAIQLKLDHFREASLLLEEMIDFWADKADYYQQLSGVYYELGKHKESFSILSVAHQNHLLSRESDLERLLQQYRYYDYPYKGAKIFSKHMKQGLIESTEKNWETLAHAWLQSHEWRLANDALRQAARLSEHGKHWLRLCQTAFQDERWLDSQKHCQRAIDKGELKDEESSAWYLLALSAYYQNDLVLAGNGFQRCVIWQETKAECDRWVEHINELKKERETEQPQLTEAASKINKDDS